VDLVAARGRIARQVRVNAALCLHGGNASLWASWVLIGHTHRLFYSGDTGDGVHFKQIGHRFGPFDVTLIENGQYNVR